MMKCLAQSSIVSLSRQLSITLLLDMKRVEQTSVGYLNIKDTMQCVYLSCQKPARPGELRIFNQIMETFSVNELAEMTKRVGNTLGYDVKINHLENPRKELEEHYYNPAYQGLQEMGVEPNYLTDDVMASMFKLVAKYKNNIREDVIFKGIRW